MTVTIHSFGVRHGIGMTKVVDWLEVLSGRALGSASSSVAWNGDPGPSSLSSPERWTDPHTRVQPASSAISSALSTSR